MFVVMRNEEYSILKSFAILEETPGVRCLDLPGLDIASLAAGFGCRTVNVDSCEKLAHKFTVALDVDGPTVIVVPIKPEPAHPGWRKDSTAGVCSTDIAAAVSRICNIGTENVLVVIQSSPACFAVEAAVHSLSRAINKAGLPEADCYQVSW